MTRVYILGAPDNEMTANESLLTMCGERVAYAQIGGKRVTAGEAYKADGIQYISDISTVYGTYFLIECIVSVPDGCNIIKMDHHNPGDPGYGASPEKFLFASSIGQVISNLAKLSVLPASWDETCVHVTDGGIGDFILVNGKWVILTNKITSVREYKVFRAKLIPNHLVLTAAADHCLAHAYASRCPGVNPDEVLRHRVAQRAAFQQRTTEQILADIEIARGILIAAPEIILNTATDHYDASYCRYENNERVDTGTNGCNDYICGDTGIRARDVRGTNIPELVEAGTRYGISYIADGLIGPDGRIKIVCSGPSDAVSAFMKVWAPKNRLTDIYGDPARGFAGGYLTKS